MCPEPQSRPIRHASTLSYRFPRSTHHQVLCEDPRVITAFIESLCCFCFCATKWHGHFCFQSMNSSLETRVNSSRHHLACESAHLIRGWKEKSRFTTDTLQWIMPSSTAGFIQFWTERRNCSVWCWHSLPPSLIKLMHFDSYTRSKWSLT